MEQKEQRRKTSKTTLREKTKTVQAKTKRDTETDRFRVCKYIKMFDVEDLIMNHKYQRPMNRQRVEEIKANWDERVCTPPIVVIKDNKKLVVDGQHRLQAMIELGYIGVECFMIEGIDPSKAFVMINDVLPVNDIDKFIQKANANKDSYEAKITKIFNEYDIEICTDENKDNVDCYYKGVKFLWDIEDSLDTNALKHALDIITQRLEYDGLISDSPVLRDVYDICKRYPESYEKIVRTIEFDKDELYITNKKNSRKVIKSLHKKYPRSNLKKNFTQIIERS